MQGVEHMMIQAIRPLAIGGLALLAVGVGLADERPEVLVQKLAEFNGAEHGQLTRVAEESVARTFVGFLFYALRFGQYPVPMLPPDPLKTNNLFVVTPDGTAIHVPDIKALEGFFRARLARADSEGRARDATKAWLSLTQELHQDGFFRFSVSDDAIRVATSGSGGFRATGRAIVNRHGGDAGEIVAVLTFDRTGRLSGVSETVTLKPGIRPICQATKLLDPDPVVRRMAEQAILVMGTSAKGYLDEQRAKASPDLQDAIDRIWWRILADER
jgi:hypothetical protein